MLHKQTVLSTNSETKKQQFLTPMTTNNQAQNKTHAKKFQHYEYNNLPVRSHRLIRTENKIIPDSS